MRSKKREYAIAVPSKYPGDFCYDGRFWRALTTVRAISDQAALGEYANNRTGRWKFRCPVFIAVDFDPAFDVLVARRGVGRFVS